MPGFASIMLTIPVQRTSVVCPSVASSLISRMITRNCRSGITPPTL